MAIAEILKTDDPLPRATLADRFREEISAWDSIMHSVFRLPPYNPEVGGERDGLEVFEQMMNDAQIRAAINTKRYALLARPWQIVAAKGSTANERSQAEEAKRFVDYALRSLKGPDGSDRDFRSTLFEMMSAFYRGFSLAELIWTVGKSGPWSGKYRYAAIKFKNVKQIGFDLDEFLNLRYVTSWTPEFGFQKIPKEKCLLFVYNQKDELPFGDSDLRSVYRHWFSKRKVMEYWNLRLQRFGIPFAYACVTSGNDNLSQRVGEMLRDIQEDSSAVFPANVKPELLETSVDGGDAFLKALDWHNQQIATGILLQTLTSSEGTRSGSLALGKVHFNILIYVLESVKQEIETAVNSQLIRPLIDLNFGHELYPRLSLGAVDETDMGQMAQVIDILLRHGVADPKEQEIREMFNLPPLADHEIGKEKKDGSLDAANGARMQAF